MITTVSQKFCRYSRPLLPRRGLQMQHHGRLGCFLVFFQVLLNNNTVEVRWRWSKKYVRENHVQSLREQNVKQHFYYIKYRG